MNDASKTSTSPRSVFLILAAIILIGGFLRFYRLTTVPPGFFRDEADKGYSAYSLLKTGRDLEGRFWPLQISSMRVYTSPVYQWASIPGIAAFGLSEWTTRFPAALIGTLTILVVFWVGNLLYGRMGGLIAAGFTALSPWALIFSRWANQGVFVPFFTASAAALFLDSLNRQGTKGILRRLEPVAAGFVAFLAFFTYEPARVFIPLFLFVVTVMSLRKAGSVLIFASIGFAVPAIPFAVRLASTWGNMGVRFQAVSIFSTNLSLFGKIGLFIANYFKHLSPGFLFLDGDANLRHSVPGWGMLFPIDFLMLVVGIAVLAFRGDWKTRIPLAGFFLAFVPASLTAEGIPHALRSITVIPWVYLVCTAGVIEIIRILSPIAKSEFAGKMPIFLIFGSLVFSSVRYSVDLFGDYPKKSFAYWEYGHREVIEALGRLRKPGEMIAVTRYSEYPEMFFLFHWKMDPSEFQKKRFIPGVVLPNLPASPTPAGAESVLVFAYAEEDVKGELLWQMNAPTGKPLWKIVRLPLGTPISRSAPSP